LGQIQRKPARSDGGAREMPISNGMPTGPGCQRPRATEAVRSEGGRPIKSGSMVVAHRLRGKRNGAAETLGFRRGIEGLTVGMLVGR
jgi:hypothetical protein